MKYLRFLVIPVGLLCSMTWIADIQNHSWNGIVLLGSVTMGCFWLFIWYFSLLKKRP